MQVTTNIPPFETITRYLEPEMNILISGSRCSYIPLPLFLNSDFTGVVTTLNKNEPYITESTVDIGLRIQCKEKSKLMFPTKKTDFIFVSIDEENDGLEHVFEFEPILKPGGFILVMGFTNTYNQILNKADGLDFERVEVFKNTKDCFFLLKKGFEFNHTLWGL